MTISMTVYVYTPELAKLRQFYEAVFGVQPADHGDWLPFALDGGTFALHALGDDSAGRPKEFQVTINVDDIEEAVDRFEAHGGRILQGVADEAFGKRALVQDPDGRQLEITQHGAS
ncbi:MAG: VOC family protein [Chloroflexi bacterium]|nr:VOC family protein [Chloroflexota bacterium]